MLFWQITKKDLLMTYRDKSSWLILILMPIVLILIFSAVFGTDDENLAMFPIDIAVVNLDQGSDMWGGVKVSDQLTDFLNSKDMESIVKVIPIDSTDEARQMIRDRKVSSAVIIPAGFSNAFFLNDTKAETQVLGDAGSTITPQVINSVIESFVTVMEANRIQMNSTLRTMGQIQLDSAVRQQLMAEMSTRSTLQKLPLAFSEVDQEGKKPMSMANYYSAAMAVMFLLFAGNTGIFSIIEERHYRTILRLRTSALNKASLVLGKFFMVVIVGLCQLAILILFTTIVTGVDWGGSWAGLAFLSLAGVSSIAGLAVFIAAITRSSESANALNWVFIQVLAFFGGSFVPIDQLPGFAQFINKLTVNGQALRGYMILMQGGGLKDVLPIGLLLLGVTVVFLGIGSYLLQYGEEGI